MPSGDPVLRRRLSVFTSNWGQSSLLTLGLAVVIRCLLRPGSELRRAREMLNRYIDGGKKRDQTTGLRAIENSSRRIRSRRA
jgi:hypothetical protein